ncbi:microfibril-associated glycoprotein 4-like [Stylophora pistillata]|uniref:microfibril-associated glycoprotein 4-like n=1 Tax=Stylophora pistillata TaxID=50429 RepID=UPI000C0430A9|nr:microfibril-associated glycoprotein 4-like [Stylophora pistillata]
MKWDLAWGITPMLRNAGESITKPEEENEAMELFGDTAIKMSTKGQKLLGAVLYSRTYLEQYMKGKVEVGVEQVVKLAEFVAANPQASYAAFTIGLKHRWTYHLRTLPDIELVEALERAIGNVFIPAMTGHTCTPAERELLALLVRLGELALKNTCETRLRSMKPQSGRLLVQKNCVELYKSGKITSGVSTINPDGIGPDFEVFCDQKTAGGGWTMIQKRLDGSVDFNRSWFDYKNGFGDLNGELWLGLDKIHRLTKSPSKLRVDLEDFDGNTAYAEYDLFQVANQSKKYQLSIETYSGTAGDSLLRHHGYLFTTKDQDNDSYEGNCAKRHKGGWWYSSCHSSNLNGFYYHGKHISFADGVNWFHWKGYYYSVKRAEMKIRPVEFQ